MHLTEQTFGNGVETIKAYTATTGRIETIRAGLGDSVQNLSFTFDTLGNLTQRVDAVTQTTDDLSYDGLNRLTQAITSNPSLPLNVTKSVTYNAIGNITAKSDVGAYTYDPARVHAVASIAPSGTGTVTASYTYDANGNMLTGRGRTVTWTSFDMVSQITQGTNWVSFTYDSEHARLKQLSSDGSTKYYLNDSISGAMAEKIVGASLSVTWNNYIMLGGEMVALKVTGATTQTRYFHKDHLGSIVALSDETGAVVERDSFDAWGQRRTPAGQDDPLYPGQSITSQITRGYTGHEQLDTVGLVHMNGRIYEPVIGKMMSPDPTVPDPINGQDYNRYAYVLNNPLSLTDPTGFQRDPPQGIQQDPGNGIGAGGEIGKSTPANGKLCDCSLRGVDPDKRLEILAQLRALKALTAAAGDIQAGDIQFASATQTAELLFSDSPLDRLVRAHVWNVTLEYQWRNGGWVRNGAAGAAVSPLDLISPAGPATPVLGSMALRLLAKLGLSRVEGTVIRQTLIANPVPSTMARVIPEGIPTTTLGRPGTVDVFVTAAEDIANMNAAQIAKRLGIPESPTGFRVMEFSTPESGVASPVFRGDPGFLGGGLTSGGAREFAIPNGPIPSGAVTRTVP